MGLSKATETWRNVFFLLTAVFILELWFLWFYHVRAYVQERSNVALDEQIQVQKDANDQFYLNEKNHKGFAEYLEVKELESKRSHLPWSTYITKILDILNKLKSLNTGDESFILLSDFKVNLKELSLNGAVGNLAYLYSWEDSLINRFNELEFLSDITIRKYEREVNNTKGFSFTLSAKVNNNATR
jgi:hypothetical protein